MNTAENKWEKSAFVSAARVVRKPRSTGRSGTRLTSILRAERVRLNPDPVAIGEPLDRIQVAPILENGQIKALRVTCACGNEAMFDIQYAAGEQSA